MSTMQVKKVSASGVELQLPSHVSLVGGLDDYTATKLASFKNTTLASAISDLSNVYLGKTATAAAATKDGSNNVIASTYYKKTDKVANATNAENADYAEKAYKDSNGNVIVDKYAQTTGTYAQMTVGKATKATTADSATSISGGQGRIDACFNVVSINANNRLTFKRANGAEINLDVANLDHANATTTKAGFMSAEDKATLNRISKYTDISAANNFDGDFNNIIPTGTYMLRDLKNWNHYPLGTQANGGILIVFQHVPNGSIQLFFTSTPEKFYFRKMFYIAGGNSYWMSWQQVESAVVGTYEATES